jgi:hypothetical protein
MSLPVPTSAQSRALSLLGQGIGPEVVASAVGVSVSYISQLLSDPEFAGQVSSLRYESLAKHNVRDSAYNSLEDSLVEKMRDCLPYMIRPLEILKAIQIINSAKRRGSSTPDSILAQKEVVSLVMPTQIIQQFTTNINNQVIQAGTQELITVQSAGMNALLEARNTAKSTKPTNPTPSGVPNVPKLPNRAESSGTSP